MSQISDDQFADWSRRLNQSDRSAFEALFRTTYPALVAYARRFTGSEAAAEDIWSRRTALDPARSLRALLYVSVRRLALNMLEKQSRQQPLDPAMHRASHPTESEEAADAELLGARFRIWIDALPAKRREAFQLSRFAGLSYEEIGRVMGLSAKTVENHT